MNRSDNAAMYQHPTTPDPSLVDGEQAEMAAASDHGGMADSAQLLQRPMSRRSVIRAGVVASGSLAMRSGYVGPSVESVSLQESLKPSGGGKPPKSPGGGKPPKPPKPPKK